MPSILISVNGELRDPYIQVPDADARSTAYKKVALNQPLVVEFRRLSLLKEGDNQRKLMISTYFKSQEQKNAAAEAVTYYAPDAQFSGDGRFTLTDFGGKDYGHPLCYYTRAYAGETLRFTIYPSELHKIDDNTVKALDNSVSAIGSMPMFAQFLPYLTLAEAGVGIFASILNFFRHDDVFSTISCDLHYNQPDALILQSGRFLCVPDISPTEPVTDQMLLDLYHLTPESKLVNNSDLGEFPGSYFVFTVDASERKGYEQFDYFQNAAALLELTNRGGDLGSLLNQVTTYSTGYTDMDTVKKLEAMRGNASDPTVQKQATALYQTLSAEMKLIYQDRFNQAFPHSLA